MAAIKHFVRGDLVVITEESAMFFDADRVNVIHQIVDVFRGGYTIAPLMGDGVDISRAIGAMVEDVREVQS